MWLTSRPCEWWPTQTTRPHERWPRSTMCTLTQQWPLSIASKGGTCRPSKLPKATTPSKSTCTDELLEGACAVTKDLTAHNNKESGAACLIRFTTNALNNTLDTGAVSKLFTDTNSNNKPYKKQWQQQRHTHDRGQGHRDNQGASLGHQGVGHGP